MKLLLVFITGFGILLTVQIVCAQQAYDPYNPPPEWVTRMNSNREAFDKRYGKDSVTMADRSNYQRRSLPRTNPDGKPYTKEELEKFETLRKPNEADSTKYADFLKQSKTGAFRLFPYLDCEKRYVIRVDGKCADFVPGSWAYSFRAKHYTDQLFFDLKFKDGNLISGSELSLGVLTSLGDVPIENVSLTSDGMKFLAELQPAAEQLEIEKQVKQFMTGLDSGGYNYSKQIKVEVNTTYGLRVVAYRVPYKVKVIFTNDGKPEKEIKGFPFSLNTSDERDDIIVAFRVVRKEDDGTLTIVWKALERTDAPKLIFQKDVKKVYVETSPR